jgi:hypothetical protein
MDSAVVSVVWPSGVTSNHIVPAGSRSHIYEPGPLDEGAEE